MTTTRSGYVSVDIGGTNMRGALVLPTGEILERFRAKSAIAEGADPFLERLTASAEGLIAAASKHDVLVKGVGVGVPGLIGADGVVHASVNLRPLEGLNLSEMLACRICLPVVAANDANLIALGEATSGAGRGMRSLVVITIGTGLGSGLILDGRLWSGAGGFAAEFGHLTVEPEGIRCPCGNYGCLEQYVSAAALSRYGNGRSPEELALLARSGDSLAIAAFEKVGYWLGTALAGLINTLNLDGIVIGGGVAAGYDLFAPALQKTLRKRAFPLIAGQVKLCRSLLGDDAGLVGGALIAASNKTG